MSIRKNFAIAILASTFSYAAAAETEVVFLEPDGRRVLSIFILGEISVEDEEKVREAEKYLDEANFRNVLIASEGGDALAAMRIGRFLRSNEFTVTLMPQAPCNSACVFILASGVDRQVRDGSVGIHRPYFTGGDISIAQSLSTDLRDKITEYFSEMNIPTSIVDEMYSVDPIDMKILSKDEIKFFRLDAMDYVYKESLALKQAERLGITRQVYELLMQDLGNQCQAYATDQQAYKNCADEVGAKYGVTFQ